MKIRFKTSPENQKIQKLKKLLNNKNFRNNQNYIINKNIILYNLSKFTYPLDKLEDKYINSIFIRLLISFFEQFFSY